MTSNVQLFVTCLVEAFYPEVGLATVKVLERNGSNVTLPPDQTCCGLPLYNNGFRDQARAAARQTIAAMPGDDPVIVPAGSCAWLMRKIYPELLPEGIPFARRVFEFCEFVARDGAPPCHLPAAVTATYHPSCHLKRGLGLDAPPRALMSSVERLTMVPLEKEGECCGFGGTFAIHYDQISSAMLDDKLDHVGQTGASTLLVTDGGCMLQLAGGATRREPTVRVRHIAEILADADPGETR